MAQMGGSHAFSEQLTITKGFTSTNTGEDILEQQHRK